MIDNKTKREREEREREKEEKDFITFYYTNNYTLLVWNLYHYSLRALNEIQTYPS